MIDLQITLAKPVLLPKTDGTGYDFCRVGEHHAVLKIGNVSLAFDGRNNWDERDDCTGEVIELMEYHDDPVRLDNEAVRGGEGPAEKLLFALAADLGYCVSREGDYDWTVCADCGRVYSGDDGCGYCSDCAGKNE
jgi:hypothetical protein